MVEYEHKIGERERTAIEQALRAGYLVEIIPMREGHLVIRTVKKKTIEIPTV